MNNYKLAAYGLMSVWGLYGLYLAGKGLVYVGLSACAIVYLEGY